jgi:glutaredoxin
MHGLLNTNEQNQKYYGKPNACPHCGSPESFLHVASCTYPEILLYRTRQQEILWKSLTTLKTPQLILQDIKRGILSCDTASSYNPELSLVLPMVEKASSSSSRSWNSTEDLSFAAFKEQMSLGWEQFLRGRISQRWREAYTHDCSSRHIRANGVQWAGGVIQVVLDYSLALWKFRCNLLYGRSKAKAEQKIMADLHRKVICTYEDFERDPFLVHQDYRNIFSVSLDRRLKQDRDSLECFLSTVDLAIKERQQFLILQSETARRFFFPRLLPSEVTISPSFDSCQMSNVSDSMDSLSQVSMRSTDNSCHSINADEHSLTSNSTSQSSHSVECNGSKAN